MPPALPLRFGAIGARILDQAGQVREAGVGTAAGAGSEERAGGVRASLSDEGALIADPAHRPRDVIARGRHHAARGRIWWHAGRPARAQTSNARTSPDATKQVGSWRTCTAAEAR